MAPEFRITGRKAGKLQFYCPLCHFHQSTSTIQRVTWKHHAQLFVLTLSVTTLGFPIFGFNGLWLYLVFWAAFEFAYRLRKRQALVCQSCGFDPFLYKQDVDKARRALRQHWEERIAKEKLFAGKKLKNYQTEPLNKTGDVVSAAAPNAAEAQKNLPAPSLNTP